MEEKDGRESEGREAGPLYPLKSPARTRTTDRDILPQGPSTTTLTNNTMTIPQPTFNCKWTELPPTGSIQRVAQIAVHQISRTQKVRKKRLRGLRTPQGCL